MIEIIQEEDMIGETIAVGGTTRTDVINQGMTAILIIDVPTVVGGIMVSITAGKGCITEMLVNHEMVMTRAAVVEEVTSTTTRNDSFSYLFSPFICHYCRY